MAPPPLHTTVPPTLRPGGRTDEGCEVLDVDGAVRRHRDDLAEPQGLRIGEHPLQVAQERLVVVAGMPSAYGVAPGRLLR